MTAIFISRVRLIMMHKAEAKQHLTDNNDAGLYSIRRLVSAPADTHRDGGSLFSSFTRLQTNRGQLKRK